MINRIFICAFSFLLTLTITVGAASIEFEEILSLPVPVSGNIEKVEFGDVNFDGHPDVLVCDGDSVILYSYYQGQVLFRYALGTLSGQANPADAAYDILLSDINRDYVLDIAIGLYDYIDISPGWFRVFFQDGISLYGPIDTITIEFETNPAGLWFMSPGLGLFDAVDFDADGYKEFIFSCDSSYEIIGPYLDAGGLGAITRIYHSFPDSVLFRSEYFYIDAEPMPEPNNDAVVLHRKFDGYSHTWGSGASSSRTGTEYVAMTDLYKNKVNPASLDPGPEYSPSYCDNSSYYSTSVVDCMGDLDKNHGGIEAAIYAGSRDCCSDGGNWECTTTTEYGLSLYSFNNPSAPSKIRSLEYTEGAYDYIYLPDHPGYYCAFVGDRFVQFNGEDGTEFQSTTNIPAGTKSWEYPFDDGRPYLITLNSNVVSIYKPAIITDTDGGEGPPLPVSLSLGNPYPNPFNATQTIPVTTKPGALLTVGIYNLLGQKVDCIYSGVSYTQEFNITWNADRFASGVYLIKAVSGEESAVVRSILLK